ncbi:MAG: hypothetical protein JNJ60_19290, partial [Rhodocyclaceae bacterium]|nr:hypothetical protein [Rhodocyclaceae bacterium]
GKIRGIKSAQVHALFDGDTREITGTADLDIPGIESASLGVRFDKDGAVIHGDARFTDRPGIRDGQISVTVRHTNDGWSVSASGGAECTFAGFTARLAASYEDGLFMFSASAPFAIGDKLSGKVTVGVTNADVGDDGKVMNVTEGANELRCFGNGSIDLKIIEQIQGGVGIKVRPDGQVLVSGRVGLARPIELFPQYPPPDKATIDLFKMPTVEIPLVGVPGVNIGLTIDGGVTAHAFIGPGVLSEAEIAVEDFNPEFPDTLHVIGRARFHLPAEAGIDASLSAGVQLSALVVKFRAGLTLGAGVKVPADISPGVDIDWKPSTGLHIHADLRTTISPKLRFSVTGYLKLLGDLLVTTFTIWRKDFTLAEREFGSSLKIGINVPVDYYSDDRGIVFDPSKIDFQVPSLNADTFDQIINGSDTGDVSGEG